MNTPSIVSMGKIIGGRPGVLPRALALFYMPLAYAFRRTFCFHFSRPFFAAIMSTKIGFLCWFFRGWMDGGWVGYY
ncbi:hypothetical protein P280DRAFT_306273 [Massarina eburnea CBS 473.64]|uniref:Uncharacterized protein n=1 Tax=Massarina eburnea CBS 473.64 TaxID=1395130 RepID=A0A6A6S2C3_9PLEO|nr:hypothetical protein P280DRAFT_306273 [Massarina eburnea CBS 473.64]